VRGIDLSSDSSSDVRVALPTPLNPVDHTNSRLIMTTRLDKTIKRELELKGKQYTVTITPQGVKITPKGARKGHEISWDTLASGDAELYRDMKISIDAMKEENQ
jgi:hypothetical protein